VRCHFVMCSSCIMGWSYVHEMTVIDDEAHKLSLCDTES
jgi:hypothetical protein